MPRPKPITEPGRILRDRPAVKLPTVGPDGAPLKARPITIAPLFAGIVNNGVIMNNIVNYNRNETNVNQYYWHNDEGVRYVHRYDGDSHWYGWYQDDDYYWTRWDQDRWWYQAPDHRWCYWQDGTWWHQRPEEPETVYVYVDNTYYQYGTTQGGVALEPVVLPALTAPEYSPAPSRAPETNTTDQPAPTPAPAAQTAEKTYYSNDGTRMVLVLAERKEAFLYDRTSGDEPKFLAFLGAGVKEVRFSNTGDGSPLQILLVFKDETFKTFDADGKPLGAQPSPVPAPAATKKAALEAGVQEAGTWIAAGSALGLGLGGVALRALLARMRSGP